MRDEQTNEVYLPLTCTVVLKRKQEMLFVRLDFENTLTVDALMDPAAYVRAIAPKNMDTKKQKSPEKYPQNRRPSQFSNTSSKWPFGKPNSNSHT